MRWTPQGGEVASHTTSAKALEHPVSNGNVGFTIKLLRYLRGWKSGKYETHGAITLNRKSRQKNSNSTNFSSCINTT